MSILEFRDTPLDKMDSVAAQIASRLSHPIVLFRADMAAGKTTLIKHLVKHLGGISDVSSPTFSIVNHYITDSGKNIYHFDFYRIDDPNQAYDMGYEEYFYSGDMCLVEWPDKIEALLPENVCTITIDKTENGRDICLEY